MSFARSGFTRNKKTSRGASASSHRLSSLASASVTTTNTTTTTSSDLATKTRLLQRAAYTRLANKKPRNKDICHGLRDLKHDALAGFLHHRLNEL